MGDEGFKKTCVALFHRLADTSGAIVLSHFRKNVAIDAKSDATPVTIADRDSETAMRELIAKAFPDHGIIGEEHGSERLDSEWLWILDPIDGTKSFINGVPLFGTLIGLWRRTVTGAQPYLGCINHPALNERWLGGADLPTTLNGVPARSRNCAGLGTAGQRQAGQQSKTKRGGAAGRQVEVHDKAPLRQTRCSADLEVVNQPRLRNGDFQMTFGWL